MRACFRRFSRQVLCFLRVFLARLPLTGCNPRRLPCSTAVIQSVLQPSRLTPCERSVVPSRFRRAPALDAPSRRHAPQTWRVPPIISSPSRRSTSGRTASRRPSRFPAGNGEASRCPGEYRLRRRRYPIVRDGSVPRIDQVIVFPGGYYVTRPGCFALVVRGAEKATRVKIGLGAPCPGQRPPPSFSDS